jgi:hypothetical protein
MPECKGPPEAFRDVARLSDLAPLFLRTAAVSCRCFHQGAVKNPLLQRPVLRREPRPSMPYCSPWLCRTMAGLACDLGCQALSGQDLLKSSPGAIDHVPVGGRSTPWGSIAHSPRAFHRRGRPGWSRWKPGSSPHGEPRSLKRQYRRQPGPRSRGPASCRPPLPRRGHRERRHRSDPRLQTQGRENWLIRPPRLPLKGEQKGLPGWGASLGGSARDYGGRPRGSGASGLIGGIVSRAGAAA